MRGRRVLLARLFARLLAQTPGRAIGIARHGQPPQRGARQPFDLDLAPRGGERVKRRGAQDFGVVAIGDDHPAAVGAVVRAVERPAIEPRRHPPEEAVAMIEIVGPFAIAQQIAALDLDLDDDHPSLGVDPHQIGAAAVAQRHFGQAPDIVAREQPRDPAAHGFGGRGLGIG